MIKDRFKLGVMVLTAIGVLIMFTGCASKKEIVVIDECDEAGNCTEKYDLKYLSVEEQLEREYLKQERLARLAILQNQAYGSAIDNAMAASKLNEQAVKHLEAASESISKAAKEYNLE